MSQALTARRKDWLLVAGALTFYHETVSTLTGPIDLSCRYPLAFATTDHRKGGSTKSKVHQTSAKRARAQNERDSGPN